jgi:hypothetical protein
MVKHMTTNASALVLATVNAPYTKQLDERELVACIWDFAKAKSAAGPVSSFFGDVSPSLQQQFAFENGIPFDVLAMAAKQFSAWSGQTYTLAA